MFNKYLSPFKIDINLLNDDFNDHHKEIEKWLKIFLKEKDLNAKLQKQEIKNKEITRIKDENSAK